MILRRRKIRLALVHNRLLMGMSICDILGSIGYLTASAATPREKVDQVYGAVGTESTCTFQGAMISFSFASPPYNAMLSIYYLMVIRYEMRAEVINVCEKFMHLFVLTLTAFSVISGVAFELYANSGGIYCSIVPYPINERATKEIGMLMVQIANAIGVLLFCIIIFSMAGVYCKVKEQASLMDRYPSIRRGDDGDNNQNDGTNSRQCDDTKTQASLYVAAYIITYLPTAIGVALQDSSNFPLSVLISITLPLQGMWNMINFIRPKFITIRQKNLSKPFNWVLKASIFSSLEEEEQKKRLAARRNRFMNSRKRKSNSDIIVKSRSSERRFTTQSSTLSVNAFNSSGNNNTQSSQRRRQLVLSKDQQRNETKNELEHIGGPLSPLSMTLLLTNDTKQIDRTIFMDDSVQEDPSHIRNQKKRRHSIP